MMNLLMRVEEERYKCAVRNSKPNVPNAKLQLLFDNNIHK